MATGSARSAGVSLFRLGLLFCGVLFAMAASTGAAQAWPDPWPYWQQNDAASTRVVDHGAWDAFLKRYLVAAPDGINRVDYGHVRPADKAALGSYLAALEAMPVTRLSRAEQRAYWINLYNAATVKLILDSYPVASIRELSSGLFSVGPWGRKLLKIEGQGISLDDIEQRILRAGWRDPRLHYALNCASLGCPNLQPVAFTAANTEELLDRGARAYVNHRRGVMISYGRLIVSSIYRWFKEDFGGTDAGVIAHLVRYADPPLTAELAGVTAIYDDHYDWRLNDAAGLGAGQQSGSAAAPPPRLGPPGS